MTNVSKNWPKIDINTLDVLIIYYNIQIIYTDCKVKDQKNHQNKIGSAPEFYLIALKNMICQMPLKAETG